MNRELHLPCSVSQVSDGFHTFQELYDHRTALFIALMRAFPQKSWRSRFHEDGTMYPDFFVAGMQLDTDQISYHLELRWWDELDEICVTLDRAPKWDGHSPSDVVVRLLHWDPDCKTHSPSEL
jgi:hypothetical protein